MGRLWIRWLAFAAVLLGTRVLLAGEARALQAQDFAPHESLLCLESTDPVAVFSKAIDMAEQAANAPDQLRQAFVMNLQRLAGGQAGGMEIKDVLASMGWDTTRPALLGIMPFVDGARTDLDLEGMLYLVVPVTDPAVGEEILRRQLLPLFYRLTHRRCQRFQQQVNSLQSLRRGMGRGNELHMNDPADAWRCPCNVKWRLEDRDGRVGCELHAGAVDVKGAMTQLQNGLERRAIGSCTYVGSIEAGMAYGVGAGYMVVAPDARVVKACLETAAGKRQSAKLALAGTGLMRGALRWGPVADLVELAVLTSWRGLRYGPTPGLPRLLALLRQQPALRFHIEVQAEGKDGPPREAPTLVLHGSMGLGDSAWAQRLRRVPPRLPALSNLLPPDAPLLVGGNILPELAEIFTLAISAGAGHEAVLFELAPLLVGREAAWSMTDATDGGVAGMPHMVLLLSRDDERVGRALDLLPDVVGGLGHLRRLPPTKVEGLDVPIRALSALPTRADAGIRQPVLFHAERSDFMVLSSSESVLRAILDMTHPEKRANPPAAGFAKCEGFQQLGGAPRAANLTAFLDAVALGEIVRQAQNAFRRERQQRWCLQRQREIAEIIGAFQKAKGQPPQTLEALRAWVQEAEGDKEQHTQRLWQHYLRSLSCPSADAALYSLQNGQLACPLHGSVAAPKLAPAEPRPLPQGVMIMLRLLGTMRLEASVEGAILKLRLLQKTASMLAAQPPIAPPIDDKERARDQEEPADTIF